MEDVYDEQLREHGRALIVAAFEVARASGKEHWQRMLAGVLKNRLLLITDGAFDEQDWGCSSFLGFVDQYPDLLRVDRSLHPPALHLLGALLPPPASHPLRSGPEERWSIRSDLWRATLDYSRGDVFVWEGGWAVPVPNDASIDSTTSLVLPTVTAEQLRSWRLEFVETHSGAAASDEVLKRWAETGMSSWSLPQALRGQWFDQLKRHVRDRLESWFREHGLEIPDDLAERKPNRQRKEAVQPELDALRHFIMECVRAMTRSELEELRLPPAALLRSRDRR